MMLFNQYNPLLYLALNRPIAERPYTFEYADAKVLGGIYELEVERYERKKREK